MGRKITKNQGWAGVSAGAAILSVVGLSLLGMNAAGIPLGPVEPQVKQEKVEIAVPVAQYKNTPAYKALEATVNEPPAGWSKNGTVVTSSQVPFPLSCVSDGVKPAMSFAQTYGVNGQSVQIVTTAYTAGIASTGLNHMIDNVSSCAGNGTWISSLPVTGLGAEAFSTTFNKGGSSTQIVSWRSGDVVSFLITGAGNAQSLNQATAFDGALASKINPVCANPASPSDDSKRSIWSGDTFTGLLVNDPVSIPKVPLPEIVAKPKMPLLGKDLTPAGFEYKNDAKVVPTPIPAEEKQIDDVERPEVPSYPVWPLLPEQPELPVVPEAPASEPPVSKDVAIQIKDEKGPGCGWSFTSTVAPNFDAEAAAEKKKIDQTNATAALRVEARNWQSSVLNYWKSYASYSQKVETWQSYSTQVSEVRAAWDIIAEQWRVYNQLLDEYNTAVANRDAFNEQKATTQKQYDAEIKVCEARAEKEKKEKEKEKEDDKNAQSPSETSKPSPSPTTPTTDSPSPTASPSPSEDNPDDKVKCPVEKPEILDQAAPSVPEKPTPPADPRPVDQRK